MSYCSFIFPSVSTWYLILHENVCLPENIVFLHMCSTQDGSPFPYVQNPQFNCIKNKLIVIVHAIVSQHFETIIPLHNQDSCYSVQFSIHNLRHFLGMGNKKGKSSSLFIFFMKSSLEEIDRNMLMQVTDCFERQNENIIQFHKELYLQSLAREYMV